MTAIRERMLRPNTGLLQFWRSPIVLCSLATGAVAAVVLGRAVTAMHDASVLRREVPQLAAQVAAEESALAFVQSDGQAVRRAVNAGNGLIVETSVVPVPQSSRYRVRAEAAEMQFDFVFQRLGGGTPLAFGRALTLGPDAAVPVDWLHDGEAEREDLPSIVAPRQQHDAADGIAAEDAGIALHDGFGLHQLVEQNLKTGQPLIKEIFHLVLDATSIIISGFSNLAGTLFGGTHDFSTLHEAFGLHLGCINDFISLTASAGDEFIALFHHPAGLT
jgi:hypothetical protein